MADIRVEAPSAAAAQRLLAAIDGKFSASLDGDGRGRVVAITLDAETAAALVELFDEFGNWLADADLTAFQIGFGDRSYALAPAASDGQPNDLTAFLLERTIQLQKALDSRLVLEQAKGILAERHRTTTEEAFTRLRHQARSSQTNIHAVAAAIVTAA